MDLNNVIKATGHVLIERRNAAGDLVETRDIPNLVVTAGKEHIADRMVGTSSGVMSHMAVGDDSTSPAAGDTALANQLAIQALTGYTASGATVTATATFAAGVGTGALVEAGLFNASSSGEMLCRTTFSVVNKAAGDTVSITWTITVS